MSYKKGCKCAYCATDRIAFAAFVVIAVLLLIGAWKASAAQVVTRCEPSARTPCTQPATFRFESAQSPYNAPVLAGGEVRRQGQVLWAWIKAGPPPTPCVPELPADTPGARQHKRACEAKVGDVLYYTGRFAVTNR